MSRIRAAPRPNVASRIRPSRPSGFVLSSPGIYVINFFSSIKSIAMKPLATLLFLCLAVPRPTDALQVTINQADEVRFDFSVVDFDVPGGSGFYGGGPWGPSRDRSLEYRSKSPWANWWSLDPMIFSIHSSLVFSFKVSGSSILTERRFTRLSGVSALSMENRFLRLQFLSSAHLQC